MRRIYEKGYTPKAKFGKQCRDCSLNQICLPELLDQRSVDEYLEETLCEDF
jgi:CRISPR-associated exonuclease Cas4